MQPRRYVLLITTPILATSSLLLGLGGAAAWYVHHRNQEASVQLTRFLECSVAAERLVLGLQDARLQMHRFLESGRETDLQRVLAIEQTTSRQIEDVRRTAISDDVRDLVEQTSRSQRRFFDQFAAAIQDAPATSRTERIHVLAEAITNDVLQPAEKILDQTQQAAARHSEQNRSFADSLGLGLLALGACGAVGGLMAGFGIARGIARQIEQGQREAARIEQLAAVGQLAAGLAHELRNPLMAMRVLVEAGREQSAQGGGLERRDLEVLDEEIARLEKLVESFLDFARAPKLQMTALDARRLIDQMLHLVSGRARQCGVTMAWRPPAEPVTIEADAVQLRQVLLNLLLNAIDAVGEGGEVTVEVRPAGQPSEDGADSSLGTKRRALQDSVAIVVSDSGPGVPDDLKEKVFEPFFSGKETGIGLGLAVSRRIVENHGGAITLNDISGGGARFTVLLPASRCVTSRAPTSSDPAAVVDSSG